MTDGKVKLLTLQKYYTFTPTAVIKCCKCCSAYLTVAQSQGEPAGNARPECSSLVYEAPTALAVAPDLTAAAADQPGLVRRLAFAPSTARASKMLDRKKAPIEAARPYIHGGQHSLHTIRI